MPKSNENNRDDFPVGPGYLEDNQYITPGLTSSSPPEQVRLPDIKALGDLTNEQLLQVLEHYGIVAPWDTLVSTAAQYVARLTELRPGSPEFAAEVQRILDLESRRGMLSVSRRVHQQWSSLDAIDGDMGKQMVWITELDSSVCEPCSQRGGLMMSYREWQSTGMPGAAVCQGGDLCRCDLVVVD